MEKNFHVIAGTHFYLMQPGDATVYRFAWTAYPPNSYDSPCPHGDSYVMESGVNANPDRYVMLSINMPGGKGVGTVLLDSLDVFPEKTHLLGYLRGHGFSEVHAYTLIAVLLALKVLLEYPNDVNGAAKAMLEASKIITTVTKEELGG